MTNGSVLADRARLADTFAARLAGLLFSPPLAPGEGLLIEPCSAIHMLGMKFAIDAIFIDRNSRVVAVVDSIAPGQLSSVYPSAHACLELPAGTARNTGTRSGDQIELTDA